MIFLCQFTTLQVTLTFRTHSKAWCNKWETHKHHLWMPWTASQFHNGDHSKHLYSCQIWTLLKWTSHRCSLLSSRVWCTLIKIHLQFPPLWKETHRWLRPKPSTQPMEQPTLPKSQRDKLVLTPITCMIKNQSLWNKCLLRVTSKTVQTMLLWKQLKQLNQFLKPDNESLSTYVFKMNNNI